MLRLFFLLLVLPLQTIYALSPTNDFIHGQGDVQISSQIDQYDRLMAHQPISGSIMVTHDMNQTIDVNSFRLGQKPLQVDFVQSNPMSSYSNLAVAIYKFQLEGMEKGIHTLPAVRVKVGGKEYEALPMVLEIPN